MTTEQPYTPTEDLIIEAWKRYSGAQDAKYARLSDGDAGDEARRFLARVRRDAAREALDGLAEDRRTVARMTYGHGAESWEPKVIHAYRDRHYPEETR